MRMTTTILLLGAGCALPPADVAALDAMTPAQIIEGVCSYERNLFQRTDEFRIGLKSHVKDITPSKKERVLAAGWQLARKGDLWYTEVNGVEGRNGREIQIAKRGKLFEWTTSDPFCFVHDFDNGWNFFQEWGYFQRLGLDIYRSVAETNQIDYQKLLTMNGNRGYHAALAHPMLPHCLEINKGKYVVRPDKEELDAAFCWVVEYPGVDKLWIDPDRGFVVRKRIYHFGFGKPVWRAIHNSNYREIKPGLWVPFTQTEDVYANIEQQPQSLWGKVIQQITYEVDYFDLSTVDDSLFSPPVKPGVMVSDSSRKMEYRISEAGSDPFAGPIAIGIRRRGVSIQLIACIVALICLTATLLWRRLRTRGAHTNV